MSEEVMRAEWVNVQKTMMFMVMVMDETWLLWRLAWLTWQDGSEAGILVCFWGSEPLRTRRRWLGGRQLPESRWILVSFILILASLLGLSSSNHLMR